MKQELVITLIIFVLLFVKLGKEETKNETLINFVNILLTLNLISGFFFSTIRDLIWRYVSHHPAFYVRKKYIESWNTDHFITVIQLVKRT